jgi:hypothetical protein
VDTVDGVRGGRRVVRRKGEQVNEWHEIPSFEGYYINHDGDVYSKLRNLIMKPEQIGKRCYVQLRQNGEYKKFAVADLVARTFIGEPKTGYRVGFKDGDSMNIAVSNLKYAPTQAMRHYLDIQAKLRGG